MDDEKVIPSLCHHVFQLMHQQLGISTVIETAGQSTEHHQEKTDKAALRDFLAVLLSNQAKSICFCDDVTFVPPGNRGPHGLLDIFVGTENESGEKLKASEKSRQSVILSHRDSGLIVKVDEGVSKQASVNLISQALPRQLKNSKVACDLKATVQPILQILSVSQMEPDSEKPTLLLFGSRSKIRPYVYIPSVDILLTTNQSFTWRTGDRIHFEGVVLALLLALTVREVKYKCELPAILLELRQFPKTGFCDAMKSAGCSLIDSKLYPQCIPRAPLAATSESSGYVANDTQVDKVKKDITEFLLS